MKHYFLLSSLYFLFFIFFSAGVFADQSSSSLNDKSSVDTDAESGAQVLAAPVDSIAVDTNPKKSPRAKKKELKEAINNQAEEVYNQAVELYRISLKEFREAKKKFNDINSVVPHYKATVRYLARIDQNIKQEKELVAQERERWRQKKLTEELERQQRLYEDNRPLQLRKEETMKAHDLEGQRRDVQEQTKIWESQERQSQTQLEVRREAIRKQLEDGVEAMYQEALSLYNQGNYTAAADKFKDVQDIIPGYKSAGQYMDQARQKSLNVNPQVANVLPNASAVPASPPASHEDTVSKALDSFDLNAK